MKTVIARLLLAALCTSFVAVVACTPAEEPKKDVTPPPPPPPPPTPAVAAIPDYSPTGDDADLKKQGAAGITDTNAATKAAELEGSIDAATKALEAAKAAHK